MAEITKEEIIELAGRYVSVESVSFPWKGELFAFLIRKSEEAGGAEDEWQFNGYGKVDTYQIDEEETPRGKWIYFYYHDLGKYPLEKQFLKLQPPHITQGRFFSADRNFEIRMVPALIPSVELGVAPDSSTEEPELVLAEQSSENSSNEQKEPSNLLQFPLQKKPQP